MEQNLTPKPEIVAGPSSHFVYVETEGDFMIVARQAWQRLHEIALGRLEKDKMSGMWGMSFTERAEVPKGVYHAGFTYKSEPTKELPSGMKLRKLGGGKYAKFTLHGSYMQLATAYPLAMKRLAEAGLKLRHDFFMETYLNTPEDTKEKDLVTEIYLPVE